MRVFAFDHRKPLEEMAGYTPVKGGAFKRLCLEAALRVQDGQPGYGILTDDRIGREELHAAAGTGLWTGRPADDPGSRQPKPRQTSTPLRKLNPWPRN